MPPRSLRHVPAGLGWGDPDRPLDGSSLAAHWMRPFAPAQTAASPSRSRGEPEKSARITGPGGMDTLRDVTPSAQDSWRVPWTSAAPPGCTCSGACGAAAEPRRPLGLDARPWIRGPLAAHFARRIPAIVRPEAFQGARCCHRVPFELDPVAFPGEYDALRRAFERASEDFYYCTDSLRSAALCQVAWAGNLHRHLMEQCALIRGCNLETASTYVACVELHSSEWVSVRASSRVDCISAGFSEAECADEAWRSIVEEMLVPGRIDVFAGGGPLRCGSRCVQWAFFGRPCP